VLLVKIKVDEWSGALLEAMTSVRFGLAPAIEKYDLGDSNAGSGSLKNEFQLDKQILPAHRT